MHLRHYSLRIKISFKIYYQCSLKLILIKKFHGTFWTTFEQHLWFNGIPGNLSNKTSSSREFHGILWNFVQIQSSMEFHTPQFHGIPWNDMELLIFPKKISMEFHGTLQIWYLKKIIFLNIVLGIWLMFRCYLAKISQKRYILPWFQYRNSYFEHLNFNENGARSAKMACCSNKLKNNAICCDWKTNKECYTTLLQTMQNYP